MSTSPQDVLLTSRSFCSINDYIFFVLFCRLGSDDNQFEISMANSGCEVHRFDPSIKSAHIQEGQHLWYHRLSVDWRDPNPAIATHKLHSNTKKLGTILNEFGHQKVRTQVVWFWLLWKLQSFVLEQGVGPDGLQRSLPTSAFLWFLFSQELRCFPRWSPDNRFSSEIPAVHSFLECLFCLAFFLALVTATLFLDCKPYV